MGDAKDAAQRVLSHRMTVRAGTMGQSCWIIHMAVQHALISGYLIRSSR